MKRKYDLIVFDMKITTLYVEKILVMLLLNIFTFDIENKFK